ncbi:MAG: spore germination protein GerW family protein [Clostridiales bacterium]|jgi:uncharacterized spore protein YtfJ|nr:spore germination protein GerW family protein [Eubacteriales bacterium]MDH7567498.1 spore germination protein GerW family protein [Clostridiales bacterium]
MEQQQNLSFTQNIDAIFTNLEEFTKKESVLGQPVTYGDKTLIPIVSVTLGYGSGSMRAKSQQNNTGAGMNAEMNPGNGLGMGAKINTEAVVVIDKDNVSMLPVGEKSNMGQMIDKIPQILMNLNQNKPQQQGQNQNQPQNPQQNQQP